jgi:hypothetical protein
MVKPSLSLLVYGLCGAIALTLTPLASGQEPKAPSADEVPLREIFVPFEDLNVILEGPNERVFLTRDEYRKLVDEAKTKPQVDVPHKVLLVSAEYAAVLGEGRALIDGTLEIDVLDEGLFILPLELAGVGIRSATLDDKGGPLIRQQNGQPAVLVAGKGRHKLTLALTAPLQTAAAQQSLELTLPTTTAAGLNLQVPGNIEVRGGAAVIDRQYDMEANVTRLSLLPRRGQLSLVLSLNNRQLQDERVVVARSVLIAEVTLGYERIHATCSYRVLHGAVEKLRLAVPAGFKITRVESPLVARWEELQEGGHTVLETTLREPTTGQVVLGITANRSPVADRDWIADLANWKFPRLVPLDVDGQVAVLGVLAEDRLRAEEIATEGLLPIDAAALAGAIPASVLAAEPGAPSVRQIVTYYAPVADYSLSARLVKPPAGLKVVGNALLLISDQGLTLSGGLALTPAAERLFEARFTLPAGWQATQITSPDGTALPVERFPLAGGGTRHVVRLTPGIHPGQIATINFEAKSTPAGWLAEWTSQELPFPELVVEGTTAEQGAIAVHSIDDLVTRPRELSGLTPLLDAEKASAGLAGVPAALAYRYLGRPFAAKLVVERTRPSITAEVFSFFDIRRENLTAHYELHYDVRAARTRRVYFQLPKETPAEISVRGLAGTTVKEFHADESGAQRRWEVQLADRQEGGVRLAVDFQQTYDALGLRRLGLPLVAATEVEYQTGFVAIEGNEELEITPTTTARRVDVGELSRAEHPVGRRVIGTFGYIGDQMSVFVSITPRDPYELPTALVQQTRLTTRVSAAGRMQSLAEFDLLTKATLIEVRLPPESTLWTISLNELPTKPQRDGDALLIALPAQAELSLRTLRVVYETPGEPLKLAGRVSVEGPKLLVRAAGTDAERLVPQADLEWKLYLPSGYVLRRSGGTVTGPLVAKEPPAAVKVATLLYEWADGFRLRDLWGGAQLGYTAPTPTSAFDDGYGYRTDKSEAGAATEMPTSGSEMGGHSPQGRSARDEAKSADALARPMSSEPLAEAAPPAEAPATEPSAPLAVPPESPVPPPPAPAVPGELEINLPPAGIAVPQQGAPNPPGEESSDRPGRSATIASLTGFSSLKIDLQGEASGDAITFTSLGSNPQLEAAVIDRRRIAAAAWGLALLVLLVGVGLTFQSATRQACYVIAVLLASSIPVLVTDRLSEVTQVFDYCFYAGCLLAVCFPLAALALGTWNWLRTRVLARCCPVEPAIARTVVVLLACVLLGSYSPLSAQEPAAELPAGVRILNWRELLPLVEAEAAPVAVPADAVIVPYDPDKPVQDAGREKLLLPYAKYVELWNRAHPDEKLAAAPPPADYAWAGASYEATLAVADSLVVRGTLEIDLFTDKPVAVPMHLAGGVLVKGTVDGQAARLQVVEPEAVQPNQPAEQAAPQPAVALPGQPPARLLLWHLSGKGRKKIELTIQLGLVRQGGWRIVRGQLPVAPATRLTLVAPTAGTELRQQHVADRPTFETKADGQQIETALGPAGLVDLSWRTKVTEGVVDQSLTARSVGVFDVRDDSLRLVWQAHLEFGRALRDAFSFAVPTGYVVEQVRGENVRGWSVKTVGPEQLIDVTLLKGVQGSESITIELARRGRVGQGELAEFAAPTVTVVDAPLQQGNLVVRRSPRLELRTLEATGLARADGDAQTASAEQGADAGDAPVLRVQPYQVFRFVRVPASLRLSAAPVAVAATAQIRAALRVAERDTTFDAAVEIRPQGAPLFRIELFLPTGFELDRIGPVDLEWAITDEANRRKLTVLLPTGQTEAFTLTLFGRIAAAMPAAEAVPAAEASGERRIAAPVLEVLGTQRLEGELAILPDPDTDVRLENLENAENLPLQALQWLAPEQRTLARAALRFRTAGYSAAIVLTPRTPQVSVRTISNIKVTPRAIEETILLNYQIEQAGVRQFAFLLPERFAKVQVKVNLLQEQIVEPATDAMGAAIPGWVRFRITLQDFVRDRFAIVVMHDRLLEAAPQTAAIPRIEAARIDQRLVVLENAGRDEIDVAAADLVGLEPLSPQLQAWRELTAILGNRITQAYQVTESAAAPSLSFRLRERQIATTAQARIELATTLLVVDEAGAYRGLQLYRVTNATEQFLEVELPPGSRLWTATVAGEPVKPAMPTAGAGGAVPTGHVRIPLIKTSEGEADYPVELKYGGQLPSLRSLAEVQFPLMKTFNINVELSEVRLLLPAQFDWNRVFQFGGTMRHVEDERDLAAVFQSYLNRRIEEASKLLTSANPYSQVRAASNLKQTKILLDDSRSMAIADQTMEGRLLYEANSTLLANAEKKIQEQTAAQDGIEVDNRTRLNSYWMEQGINRSKNVVSGLASNFDGQAAPSAAESKPSAFNDDWLQQNELKSQSEQAKKDPAVATANDQRGNMQAGGKYGGRFFRGGENTYDRPAQDQSGQAGEGQALQLFNQQQRESLERQLGKEGDKSSEGEELRKKDMESLSRYGMNLDRNYQQQEQGQLSQSASGQQPGMPAGGAGGGGGFGAQQGDFDGRLGGMGSGGAMGPGGAMPGRPGGDFGATQFPPLVTGESLESLAAGLASLDFQLPERGEVFLFTVPRGQIEIKAWPIAHELVRQILGGAGLIAALVLIWLATRPAARRFWRQLVDQPLFAICLGVLGLASLVTGVLPGLGLLLVVLAAGLGVRWLCCIRPIAA